MNNGPEHPQLDEQLHKLFEDLRRQYRFPLGVADFAALQEAMLVGFGLRSRSELRRICCLLWASSAAEQQILYARFDNLIPHDWRLDEAIAEANRVSYRQREPDIMSYEPDDEPKVQPDFVKSHDLIPQTPDQLEVIKEESEPEREPAVLVKQQGLPPLPGRTQDFRGEAFIFVPQFPLSQREIVQAWRRVRRPQRFGPPVELQVSATLASRATHGVASLVFAPPLRSAGRLLLLIDRGGWMSPFHHFCDFIVSSLRDVARIGNVEHFYFHNTPAYGADREVLKSVASEIVPTLDSLLTMIEPLERGVVFRDPELVEPLLLADVLRDHAERANVVVVSDAGAASGRYDVHRLLDTIAFLKALRFKGGRVVWLNPFPRSYWNNGIAAQIQRHVSMVGMDRSSLHRAVDILRGKPTAVERPV